MTAISDYSIEMLKLEKELKKIAFKKFVFTNHWLKASNNQKPKPNSVYFPPFPLVGKDLREWIENFNI